ncbi:MAG: helix-hairpin-helix domain-containing protein [Phycisphaerae bacterium]|nr:helix-hairpin-helix domain-containing protein [Phycisphaerae bacterium]MDD5381175.1 helix-hairpin-helix domain-containing protein [Phycisphaerae bacterium]
MVGIVGKPGTREKLEILSTDAQYDLACACGSTKEEHRRRSGEGKWIYPITLPNGGKSVLFKTLISNLCTNDCKYCPLREKENIRRCSLGAEETAKVFLDYYDRRKVFGLFLSSGVFGSADTTMERLNLVARLLREKHRFRGYIHLKVIPGASDAAIEDAVSLASAVSLNIETPGEMNLAKLSNKKNYIRDIINPIKLISRLTGRGAKYERVKQTTQFIVGAAGESDTEIVKYMWGLYDRLKMHRVYFSAYQKGLGNESIPGEKARLEEPEDMFVREHRLYQVDFLMRKYGFKESDIVFNNDGNLSLSCDPKEAWAQRHPETFPVNVNRASKWELLRVPGLGPVTVKTILERRRQCRLSRIEELGKVGVRLGKASNYVVF